MVVITIIGLIMAAVGVAVIPRLNDAKVETARSDIHNIQGALKLYYAKKGEPGLWRRGAADCRPSSA